MSDIGAVSVLRTEFDLSLTHIPVPIEPEMDDGPRKEAGHRIQEQYRRFSLQSKDIEKSGQMTRLHSSTRI